MDEKFKVSRYISKYPGILQKFVYFFLQDKIDCNAYYEHLSGKEGLEIGGPSQIFRENDKLPIYPIIKNLDGCNFSQNTIWEGKIEDGDFYNYYDGKSGHQYICDAVDLDIIEEGKYDFLLASHVLEHIANPFKAIKEWLRVLKDDGIILIIVPHKEATFDHKREVTTLSHLIKDFESKVDEKDLTHLPEIIKLHDYHLDPPAGTEEEFRERSLHNYKNRALHHHVFDTDLLIELLTYFKIEIISVDLILPLNIIALGQKTNF